MQLYNCYPFKLVNTVMFLLQAEADGQQAQGDAWRKAHCLLLFYTWRLTQDTVYLRSPE